MTEFREEKSGQLSMIFDSIDNENDEFNKKISKKEKIKFNTQQQIVFDELINSRDNIFLTGSGGTGKSFVLNKYMEQTPDIDRLICAPTGIAACNVGGLTLHSTFGIDYKKDLGIVFDIEQAKKGSKDEKLYFIAEFDELIIDEISMVSAPNFDFVNKSLENANKIRENRGKDPIRIILCGDFLQIPPVVKSYQRSIAESTYGDKHAFSFLTDSWKKLNFKVFNLSEVKRASDPDFVTNVNKLRVGDTSCFEYFDQEKFKIDRSVIQNGSDKEFEGIIVTSLKDTGSSSAAAINKAYIDSLPGRLIREVPECFFDFGLSESERNDENNKNKLRTFKNEYAMNIKPEAKIMFNKNDPMGRFYNGSFGIFKEFKSVGFERIAKVELCDEKGKPTGNIIAVETVPEEIKGLRTHKTFDENGNIKINRSMDTIATGKCFPFQLGKAISIHKSQGQTFPHMCLYPSNIFDDGQLYVALSRATGPDAIRIVEDLNNPAGEHLKIESIITNENVLNMYADNFGKESHLMYDVDNDGKEIKVLDKVVTNLDFDKDGNRVMKPITDGGVYDTITSADFRTFSPKTRDKQLVNRVCERNILNSANLNFDNIMNIGSPLLLREQDVCDANGNHAHNKILFTKIDPRMPLVAEVVITRYDKNCCESLRNSDSNYGDRIDIKFHNVSKIVEKNGTEQYVGAAVAVKRMFCDRTPTANFEDFKVDHVEKETYTFSSDIDDLNGTRNMPMQSWIGYLKKFIYLSEPYKEYKSQKEAIVKDSNDNEQKRVSSGMSSRKGDPAKSVANGANMVVTEKNTDMCYN